MIGASKYASCVWIELYVYDLRVISTADVDEGVELDADRAVQGGKHGVGMGVFEGDDIVGAVGCGIAFLVGDDV